MKTFLLFISAALFFSFNSMKQTNTSLKNDVNIPKLVCPTPPSFAESIKNESKKGEEEIDQGWYQKAIEHLEKEEYNISYCDEHGAYQSPNRVNNMRFIYHKDGFTAKTRDARRETQDARRETQDGFGETSDVKRETEDEWSVDFKLSNVKRQTSDEKLEIRNYELGIKDKQLIVSGNKAYIEDENIRIDYINTEDGMRQDFIIKQRPEGEGKLRLNISADTKLKMIVGADALMFKDWNGEDKMKYSALKCWDANGRELRAYFEESKFQVTSYELREQSLNEKVSSFGSNQKTEESRNLKLVTRNLFAIVVNDEDAVYPITIDPLSTSPNWTAVMNVHVYDDISQAYFGQSVSTAGDVNNDGYSDVIVNSNYEHSTNQHGVVYVYHGSAAGLSITPNWTYNLPFKGENAIVSTAGDVNRDGFSDVIVGTPSYTYDFTLNRGKVYVFHGSPSGLSNTENWTDSGKSYQGRLGSSVSTAGDVNGDGFSDVIVGEPGGSDTSRVYVYHGSASGLSKPANWTVQNNQINSEFGSSVSTAGDVNGDGFSDVIVGAHYFDNVQLLGKAFVYHGSSSGLSQTSDWTAEGDQFNLGFGFSVSTAGDVNGDGYSDVIVGAPGFDVAGDTNVGRAYVFHGSDDGLNLTSNWYAEGDEPFSFFGGSVATAGDVNGDGYSDVIIGARGFDAPTFRPSVVGRAYVYHGSASGLSATENWYAEGRLQIDPQFLFITSALFGSCVATAGDVNGDGYSDVIIGEPKFDTITTNENYLLNIGKAYVYQGSASGLSSADNWTAESNQGEAFFGWSVSTAGDINGDGYSDIIVGAPMFDNGQNAEGSVFIYHGSETGLTFAASLESNLEDAQFGISVSTAGDVNGDGYADVIIGANIFNQISNDGRVYVYYGSSGGISATANWIKESPQLGAQFGYDVSTAGDVNGDGYSDVIVGANYYGNGQSKEGRAYVYHGSSSGLSAVPNWVTESNQANAFFGESVSTAGDVNGDGHSDVIIGSPTFSSGQTNEGRAFVYFGSPAGLSASSNWSAEVNQDNANFGISVSTAGDVNGDGYSDVIIGANLFDNGQNNEGRAYVYHGSGDGLPPFINWTSEGDQPNANFGISVSTAGDVNGDGYSDVIVGANLFDNPQNAEGRAFVYHGSPLGLSAVSNWTAESNQALAGFGNSVSTAGDVNGDGYSDVIVGASNYFGGQLGEGKTFVYYGNGGTGKRATIRQYKPGTTSIVYSGGLTGTNGQFRQTIFGKSPFGRADGRIVYEHRVNGLPFSSGTTITNSVASSGTTNFFVDLGTDLLGVPLNVNALLLSVTNEYKWRARVQYRPANNPYQKFGPWKYYTNYVPVPYGDIKPQAIPPAAKTLSLSMLIQGFYRAATDSLIRDTVTVNIRNYISPFAIIDSKKLVVSSSGLINYGTVNTHIINNTLYYIQVSHRNSLETWNKGSVFTKSSQTFDFRTLNTKAYGDNMVLVDDTPVRYAIYSGDVNQDGVIETLDLGSADNDAFNFVTGYVNTDVNGNNVTDASDLAIIDNNAFNFVSKVTPP